MDLTIANSIIDEFSELISKKEKRHYEGNLKVGVDLGTANIVIAVVDQSNNPVAGVSREASVVKDGIVVDYIGATEILKELKKEIEEILGETLSRAATAIPPGIIEGNVKVICNVVESAGFQVSQVIDEPTAAAKVLGIKSGAVVDVGGGTTGISIMENDNVLYTMDEATGGTHMTLVTAGAKKLSFEEAEALKKKKENESEIFMIVKPVVEKMASIVKKAVSQHKVDEIYVVGGACTFSKFEEVFRKEIGINVYKPHHPLLVTPLGIAMYSN